MPPTAEPGAADRAALIALEQAMWRASTRFDPDFMERHLAPEFFEFGRSGRVWSRAAIIAMAAEPIDATLSQLTLHPLDADAVLVTYDSALRSGGALEHAYRSSLWTRRDGRWQLRFHQGTPFTP